MGSWASWRNTCANHNYNLYNMVCASVHFSGTFGTSTNFLCTRQRVLSRQKLPNLYQVFPSVFGEDTHDPIYCRRRENTGVLSGAVWLSGGAANRLAERNSSTAPSTLPLSPDEK